MTSKKSVALLAGAAAVAMVAGADEAAAIPVTAALQSGNNTITDNSAELFVNKVGSATTIDIGDIFLGGIQIDKINNQTLGTGGWNELTGVFGLQVLAVTPIGGGLGLISFGALGTLPTSGDLQAEIDLATGIDIGATAPGTFARFFEDTVPDATRDGSTFLNFITETSDGTMFIDTALAPGGLSAIGFTDLSLLTAECAAQAAGGVVGGGLPGNFFNNGSGVTVSASSVPNNIVVGSAVGVSGTNQCPVLPGEDFTVRDDATFTVMAVPEPLTLSVLGMSLLGLGYMRRRQQCAA
jgi:hypothetical protein